MSCTSSGLAFQRALCHKPAIPATLPGTMTGSPTVTDIVLVHSSDLHVDDDPHQGPYGDDGTTGLRVVLNAAGAEWRECGRLVGDIFESKRQRAEVVETCVALLNDAGRPVIVLPGNHDP